MEDRKIQEIMSKLKVGADVSLECLEELLRDFSQPSSEPYRETSSYTSTDVFIDDSAIPTVAEKASSISDEPSNSVNNISRGTNFLELASTVSIKGHRNLTLFHCVCECLFHRNRIALVV